MHAPVNLASKINVPVVSRSVHHKSQKSQMITMNKANLGHIDKENNSVYWGPDFDYIKESSD